MKLNGETVAVVTGAGSGIGRALSRGLFHRGCRLLLADRDEEGLERLRAELGAGDERLLTQATDVSKQASLSALAEHCRERFGPADLLINNAGIALCQTVEATEDEAFERVMQVNFWGMVYGTRAFLPMMLERGRGSLVFLSSILGVIGAPTQSAYCASKFAIRGYAECLRQEVAGRGLEVVVVCPGGVRTNIIRNARVDQWQDAVPGAGSDPVADFERMARTTPEGASEQILAGVEKGRARVLVGGDARWLDRIQRLFPASYSAKVQRLVRLGGG